MIRILFARLTILGLIGAGLARSLPSQSQKPTIVLVHGAFADGSSWQKVIPILQRDGYSVIAVQNPLTRWPRTSRRRSASSLRKAEQWSSSGTRMAAR